jgi:hypothetical protein
VYASEYFSGRLIMSVLEERIDALEEFLLATSSLNRFIDASRRIAKQLDSWNHPPSAIRDFDGMYQDLENEPYCNDRANLDAYLLRTYGVGEFEDVPPLEERRGLRQESPDHDTLWDLALNRISIYAQMSQRIGVIRWVDEVDKTFHLGVSAEVEMLRDIMGRVPKALKTLIEKYPSQALIGAGSGYSHSGE